MSKQLVRCSRCVLPETTPGIKFDNDGVCNYCHSYQHRTFQGEDKLLEILGQYRGKGANKYDCMAPISGGRDSTFLLWKLVHDYKMHPLAVHYDNPFSSKQATRNLESAVKQLGTDLIKWTYPDKSLHEKESRKALKIWSRKPSHSMLPIICSVCKGWWPNFIKISRQYQVPLIVIGSNPYESATFKEASFGSSRTYFRPKNLVKTFTKGTGELLRNPGYLKCSWPSVIKMFLMASHSSPVVRYLYKDRIIIRIFDYLPWNESVVLDTISKNLGWQKDPDCHSPWRFDCRLDHIKKFLYMKTIGVSELEDLFSKMVREGMISREECLERLKIENTMPFKLVEGILSQINLKIDDLNWPREWLTV